MVSAKLRKAAMSAPARICLANAADGHSLGLHTSTDIRAIGGAVCAKFSALPPPDQTDDGLLVAIDEGCRGDILPAYKRGPSPFLGAAPKALTGIDGGFSTVVNGGAISRIVAADDYDRLCGALLVTSLASASIAPGSYAEQQLMDRSAAARDLRRVKLASGQQLGNPVLWMTRTALADGVIENADRDGIVRAKAVTDLLGLIMPKFNATDSSLNQRFVLHIPMPVILRKVGFRPTFVEAGGYPRFKARPISAPPPPGWGKTLDLGSLADYRKLVDGLDEITLWPLLPSDFNDDEFIELEYLGSIGQSRGEDAGVDCDDTVAHLLMDGRSVAKALRSMR